MSAAQTREDRQPRRGDARLRRAALLAAVGELLAERGTGFSLAEAAGLAGVSTATAYRNFADTDSAIDAFFADLIADLLAAFDRLPAPEDPVAAIRAVCQEWVTQASRWGAAAVHVRSPRGVLARRGAADPVVGGLYDRLDGLVEAAITGGRVPPQDVRFAVLMWVTIFDERVVVDLTHTLAWSADQAAEHLTEAFLRVLHV
ncbi:TetR/AcrR family transcriptional regulator [Actinoplanes sp. NEAU-A12]|uniref:TetR/AcrR family transcriptional regulator n=1 Tax=Actinoplanes sandaracinus TaxID=3045177 RepID=A0ABT6WQQ7_9ACTN|nr:TetR/AcrR family transcriptional regulator [Actinoplanes sandaracinus]MDI6102076.1 TetR/AcrR family transcriptional regulator [Actinoplanes sandaracinus]